MKQPKKKIEVVHYLIQRISPTEKRHFKLHNQIYKGKNKDFIKLFDFLNKMPVYERNRVEDFFTKEKVIQKNIVISYLLDKILETITSSRGEVMHGAKALVTEHVKKYSAYYHSELFELAHEELEKAEKIALKYDLLSELIDVYGYMREVIFASNSNPDEAKSLDELLGKRKVIVEKWMLKEQISDTIIQAAKGGYSKPIMKEVYTKLNAMRDKYHELPTLIKINYNLSNFIYCVKSEKIKEANLYMQENVRLWEENPHFIVYEWEGYLVAWYNLIKSTSIIGNIDMGYDFLKQYQSLPQKHTKAFKKIPDKSLVSYHYMVYTLEAELSIAAQKYTDVKKMNAKVRDYIKNHPLTDTWRVITNDLLLRLIYANILIKDYKHAQYWVNVISETQDMKNARAYYDLELLKMILYYEEGLTTLQTSLLRSLNRQCNLKPTGNPNAMIIIGLMKQLQAKRKQKTSEEMWNNACQEALNIKRANA